MRWFLYQREIDNISFALFSAKARNQQYSCANSKSQAYDKNKSQRYSYKKKAQYVDSHHDFEKSIDLLYDRDRTVAHHDYESVYLLPFLRLPTLTERK
jgi:hypothetical protein